MEQPQPSPVDSDVVQESKQLLKRKIKTKADKIYRAKPARSTIGAFKPLPTIPSQVEQKYLLQTAFKIALTGGTFIDAKFYAFSRRRASGIVDKPLPLYANSAILRTACPFFEGLLAPGFEEGKVTNIDSEYPLDRPANTHEYDYDSDSDLDEEEELDELVDDWQSKLNLKKHLTVGDITTEIASSISRNNEKSADFKRGDDIAEVSKLGRLGRIVYIPDVAHNTFKALIFYICTGQVLFRPLKSSPKSDQSPSSQSVVDHLAPLCSPKSMYRLADRLGLNDLKTLCLTEIQGQLSPQNIVPELFSEFTSRYPAIRDFEISYICDKSHEPTVADILPVWIEAVTNGSLPHSTAVMTLLIPRLLRISRASG